MTLKEIHKTTPDESMHPNNNTHTFVFDDRSQATELYLFLSEVEGIEKVELTQPSHDVTRVVLKLKETKAQTPIA